MKENNTPGKIRFAIIGSGWRSLYYVRIAQRLPEVFELCAMLCRTEGKARMIAETYHIRTVTSESDVIQLEPEFVVAAVSKTSVSRITLDWIAKGFPVLAETPCALNRDDLKQLWNAHMHGAKLVIAEQYHRYPQYQAVIKLTDSGIIGEPSYLYLSLAHEYHAASLMRRFLQVPYDTPFSITAQEMTFPAVETASRYERFYDGHVSEKKRVNALIRFDNGKACLYDFDSDQYRSPIRSSNFRLQGLHGEINNSSVRWLDDEYVPHQEEIVTEARTVEYQDINPNLRFCREITKISFCGDTLYEPPFGQAGLSNDETAIACILSGMGEYSRGGISPYSLQEAFADAYTAVLLKEALETSKEVSSQPQFLFSES